MQKISIAVAALIGVNAIKFIDDYESKFDNFAQTTAQSAAQSGSGVRAQWTELPNCQTFVVNGPTMTFDKTKGEVIPLNADLTNASIATCKGPAVAHDPQPAAPAEPITDNIPVAKSQIYDPVWKSGTVIPDQQHQVSNQQNGVVDKSAETAGPSGDFAPKWKYTNGARQPYQESGASWNPEGAGGVNSTTAATSPTNYGPNPTPATMVYVPEEEMTIQLGWVELPNCTGAAGEKPLLLGLENVIEATCKADSHSKTLSKDEKAANDAAAQAVIDAANAKAAEIADGQAAQDSQKNAAKAPVVVDPNTEPADAATVKAISKEKSE